MVFTATLAAVCVPRRASASDVVVQWSAPAGCPSGDDVTARVVALALPHGALDAEVAVTESGGRFDARLRVKSRGATVGERILRADSCEELAESAAVVLAMSVAALAEPPPAPALSAGPVESARPAVSPPASAPHPSRDALLRVSPLGATDVGTLPNAVGGGGLSLSLAPGHGVAFGVAASLFAGANAYAAKAPAEGASFSLVSSAVTGCYALLRRPIELSPCVLAELEHVVATGQHAQSDRTTTANWIALGGGLRSRWELSRNFGIQLEVDGAISTRRQQFLITGLGTVFTTSPVAFRAYVGPEVRF
jgi:hypothetical protein